MPDTPNCGIPYVPEGTLDPAAGLNLSLNVIDALLQTAVISMSESTPPSGSSVSDGDLYIIAATATGDWAGKEDYLARYVAEGDLWEFYEPGVKVHYVFNKADNGLYAFNASDGWTLAAGLGDAPHDGTIYGRKDGAWEAAPGGASASVSIGTISTISSLTLDLTAQGDVDWFAWDSNQQVWSDANQKRKRKALGNALSAKWTAGAPSTSAISAWGFSSASYSAEDSSSAAGSGSITNGCYRSCAVGDALLITLPAGPESRILKLYMSNADHFDVTARLSDGTTDSELDVAIGSSNIVIPITYSASSYGQRLYVAITKRSSTGNLALSVATVETAP